MSQSAPQFACPHCGSLKTWKAHIAGKHARCSCGKTLTIPDKPLDDAGVADSLEDAFAIAAFDKSNVDIDANAPLQLAPSATKTPAFVPPPIVIEREEADGSVSSVTRTTIRSDTASLPYRKGLQREAPPPAPTISPPRDYILPAILIVVGLALCLLDGTYKGDDASVPLRAAIGSISFNIAASLALAIGAVFAASAMGGVAFHEPIPLVIYKLCAVALAPGAIGSLATHWIGGFNGDMAGVFIGVGCYFALFFALFRIAMTDRVVCVLLMFIIRTAVAYMVFKLQGVKDGSSI